MMVAIFVGYRTVVNFCSVSFSPYLRHNSTIRRVVRNKIELVAAEEITAIGNQFEKRHVDLGSGDSKYIYRLAKKNPRTFYLGIDTNADKMGFVAWKAEAKVARGGLPAKNLALLHLAVEEIPDEFSGFADKVTVNYPWGALLEGVTNPDPVFIKNIAKVCNVSSELILNLNYSLYGDEELIDRLNIKNLRVSTNVQEISKCFARFRLVQRFVDIYDSCPEKTTWGQHLTLGAGRKILSMRFEKLENRPS